MKYCCLATVLLVTVLTSCQHIKINYVGNQLAPTTKVDMYFDKKEIHEKYNIIGKAIVHAPQYFTSTQIQQKLIQKAELEGANAILILNYKQQLKDASAYNQFQTFTGPSKNYAAVAGPWWEDCPMGYEGPENIDYYYVTVMNVLFLEYKK